MLCLQEPTIIELELEGDHMRRIVRSGRLAACAALLVAASPAAWSFGCDPGSATCTCSGSNDCGQMGNSGMCGSSLSCSGQGSSLSCTCVSSRVKPGNGDSGSSGPRKPPNEATPPTSARPPP
jgi:hypothetical protein